MPPEFRFVRAAAARVARPRSTTASDTASRARPWTQTRVSASTPSRRDARPVAGDRRAARARVASRAPFLLPSPSTSRGGSTTFRASRVPSRVPIGRLAARLHLDVRTPLDVRPRTPSESESRPSLAGYPEDRGRLSLALDPYSRMSLPNRKGNPEVQKRPTSDIFWGFLLCFLTLAILTLVDARVHVTRGLPFLHGAWAAISVLAFGTLDNPAARVYNCVVGTVASTFIAAALIHFMGPTPIARALGISVALAFMMWTGSVHPPGAACVFAAVDSAAIQSSGSGTSCTPCSSAHSSSSPWDDCATR